MTIPLWLIWIVGLTLGIPLILIVGVLLWLGLCVLPSLFGDDNL